MAGIKAIMCADTINDMINSEDLRAEMIIFVAGSADINDGGAAFYYITDKNKANNNMQNGFDCKIKNLRAVPIILTDPKFAETVQKIDAFNGIVNTLLVNK